MQSIEVKFLFEGILFTTTVHILKAKENPRLEFFVTFTTKYLIKEFGKSLRLIFENNRFSPFFPSNQKEKELIRSIQDALINHTEIVRAA